MEPLEEKKLIEIMVENIDVDSIQLDDVYFGSRGVFKQISKVMSDGLGRIGCGTRFRGDGDSYWFL